MLLCPNCHKRIDDLEPDRFNIEALLEMKERHLAHRPERSLDDDLTQSATRDMIAYFIEHRHSRVRGGSQGRMNAAVTQGPIRVRAEVPPPPIGT